MFFVHGNLTSETKALHLATFLTVLGLVFFVCTDAFGAGVDQPEVLLVVHVGPPHTPLALAQQLGRAGRGVPRAVSAALYDGRGLALLQGDADQGAAEAGLGAPARLEGTKVLLAYLSDCRCRTECLHRYLDGGSVTCLGLSGGAELCDLCAEAVGGVPRPGAGGAWGGGRGAAAPTPAPPLSRAGWVPPLGPALGARPLARAPATGASRSVADQNREWGTGLAGEARAALSAATPSRAEHLGPGVSSLSLAFRPPRVALPEPGRGSLALALAPSRRDFDARAEQLKWLLVKLRATLESVRGACAVCWGLKLPLADCKSHTLNTCPNLHRADARGKVNRACLKCLNPAHQAHVCSWTPLPFAPKRAVGDQHGNCSSCGLGDNKAYGVVFHPPGQFGGGRCDSGGNDFVRPFAWWAYRTHPLVFRLAVGALGCGEAVRTEADYRQWHVEEWEPQSRVSRAAVLVGLHDALRTDRPAVERFLACWKRP